jgi:hypothetical protein
VRRGIREDDDQGRVWQKKTGIVVNMLDRRVRAGEVVA